MELERGQLAITGYVEVEIGRWQEADRGAEEGEVFKRSMPKEFM